MERDGALPDRCVVCNEPAARRVARTLYCSPLAWRIGAFFTPFVLLWLGMSTGPAELIFAFWPAAVVLFVAHFFVRKKLRVELGVCQRHWRVRLVLQGVSLAAMAVVFLVLFNFHIDTSGLLLALAALAVIVLAIAQSHIGLQAVAARRLTAEHAWLAGTGRAFRETLPELPGA